jgi:hypothetical protein
LFVSHQSVEQAIGPLVEALRADGADVEVAAVRDGTAELRLLLDDASCAECVMPADVLEALFLDAIAATDQSVDRVRFLDPREPARL